LIDLLGMEQFELVQQILENRENLKEEIMANYIREKKLRRLAQEGAELQNNPLLGNIVIQSKAQSQIRKEVRKEQKKMKRELNKIVTGLGDEEKLEIELARKEQMRL
ncbi:Protein Y54E2A.4, partial [Aphelenchoides avenae]